MTTSMKHQRTKEEDSGDFALTAACQSFLYREAEYLDRRRFDEWLTMLHHDLEYTIPVRITVGSEDLDAEFNLQSVHTRDTYKSIEMRVRRLQTEHAFAENPPSRTSRLVSNVQVHLLENSDVEVKSKFMLYRAHGGSTVHELVVGDRHDVLCGSKDRLRLLRRTVYLAHTTLPTINLGVFL